MVVLVPLPEILPGFIVHVPVPGKPVKITLPVDTAQLGWVIVPTVGATGVAGWVLITTLAEIGETQVTEFVTVKL